MMKLQDYCTEATLYRTDLIGDTHTVRVRMGNREQEIDVTHVMLPFSHKRVGFLNRVYGINGDALMDVYRTLANQVANHIRTCTALREKGMQDITNVFNVDVEKENGVSHTYIMSRHYIPLRQALAEGKLTYNQAMDVAGRMSMVLRDLHAAGRCHGNITLDAIFIDAENGHYVLGDFRYSALARNRMEKKLVFDLKPYDSVREQMRPIGYDMYALSSVICDLCSGNRRTFYGGIRVLPQNAPPELVRALTVGFRGRPEDIYYFRRCVYEARKAVTHSDVGSLPVSHLHSVSAK